MTVKILEKQNKAKTAGSSIPGAKRVIWSTSHTTYYQYLTNFLRRTPLFSVLSQRKHRKGGALSKLVLD